MYSVFRTVNTAGHIYYMVTPNPILSPQSQLVSQLELQPQAYPYRPPSLLGFLR